MYAILCTDGQIDYQAVVKECRPEKWIPIFAYYHAENPEKPVIPIFHTPDVARNFAKRNLPNEWQKGAVFVIPENITWMKEKGWEVLPMSFPRRMTGLKDIRIGFEIMEFISEPEIKVSR